MNGWSQTSLTENEWLGLKLKKKKIKIFLVYITIKKTILIYYYVEKNARNESFNNEFMFISMASEIVSLLFE